MMICVVIKGPTYEQAHLQIAQALAYADLVELRLDFFTALNVIELKKLQEYFCCPMIFALRSQQEGGSYLGSEEARLVDIRRIAALQPQYLDLEWHIPAAFVKEIALQYPEIKLILSSHHFQETPEDLEGLYQKMRKTPATLYKIAVTATHCLDVMRFLCWVKEKERKAGIIAISMGPHGQVSRILAPLIGSLITYATIADDQQSAPGQLPARILIERYHYRSLTPSTAIYGLIGDPVDLSISDETHNHLIQSCGLNAVYVKIRVIPSELPEFLQWAKKLPLIGLSVTMPLKESLLPCLDHIDPQAQDIGAVNTLSLQNGAYHGFNTDGMGALNAIEQELLVTQKRIVIIGSGGAAKAIAYEAIRRGGLVTIVRHSSVVEQMATCAQAGYDVLINCTPDSMPISPETILPQALVMDIKTKPRDTPFLQCALKNRCKVIYGYQMFVEQAVGQFSIWFGRKISAQACASILKDCSESSITVQMPPLL